MLWWKLDLRLFFTATGAIWFRIASSMGQRTRNSQWCFGHIARRLGDWFHGSELLLTRLAIVAGITPPEAATAVDEQFVLEELVLPGMLHVSCARQTLNLYQAPKNQDRENIKGDACDHGDSEKLTQ